ncbi:MAG: hypothetical protein WAT39_18400 [Planctomycetota bacterium]
MPLRCVVDIERIDCRGAKGRRIFDLAVQAGAWLAERTWCRGVRRVFLGASEPRRFGVFLVELSHPPAGFDDEWLWVIAGDLPPAFMVIDDLRTPRAALAAYVDRRKAWIAAVRAGGSTANLMPVVLAPTVANAGMLAKRLRELERSRRLVLATGLVRRATPHSRSAGTVAPGVLAVDNHGRDGIVAREVDCPDPNWLDLQSDARVRRHRRSRWWKLFPMSGGSVLAPEPLLVPMAPASELLIAIAAGNANAAGRRDLAMLSPTTSGPRSSLLAPIVAAA